MEVIFQQQPDLWIGNCVFRNTPTIIQWKDTPILEVGKFVDAGFTTKFAVFHSDGTQIAVVKGSQIYPTEAGKKAKITPRYFPNLTAFELEGKTILELRRDSAAALRGWAELYAPEGVLIKSTAPPLSQLTNEYGSLLIGGFQVMDAEFEAPIGIHYVGDGNVRLGITRLRYVGPDDQPPPFESIS